ncbi:MAG: Flp pilus assembly complex ATPase component TadA [candidate division Zixibacteria bacterium]|nr:Flp pilus assembly complex ATPase component TadA [candidate division Zixibacteria bacterium]
MAKKKIGDLLVERGFLTKAQLQEGLKVQSSTGRRLGEVLTELGYISEEQLLETISERLLIPRVSLKSMVIDPATVHKVSVDLARRYSLIPIFHIGKTLTIAMADPLNILAIDEIKYRTGLNIKRAVAFESEIREAIDLHYSVADSLSQIIGKHTEEQVIAGIDEPISGDAEQSGAIAKLVHLMITKAVKEKASDIHIEPGETRTRIRYRSSGVMREEAAPPKSMQNELVSRIKIAANLDVSEKRLPQDGRFMMSVEGTNIDLRVSTLPTIHGEKIVIRILDSRNLIVDFKDLGFSSKIKDRWLDIIHQPEGLILLSGPTSSGKTTTMYATLHEINTIEKNIITVEDPVEYSLPLINQVQINEKAGLSFPSTLRSILRQNPDIIMIGEIRDLETAQITVRSALTGHLVFSTIHTNDAPSAIARLIDMGIESYLVATALKGVLAQRLVRTNCPDCLESYRPSEAILHRAGLTDISKKLEFKRGSGCPKCKNTGYKGQVGIFEFIEITPYISELIIKGVSVNRLREESRKHGFLPLFEMGMEKITEGKINLEELISETSNIEDISPAEKDDSVETQYARTL